ncbi:MAG: TolC family protein [Bacteroidales bacterium]|jgi:outer membrane protein TolC|nr:TolC family protein [Bacteroidales bacterium]HOL98526.1 TolC family protein [Bacteroidales bacterium]HOM35685.1 TolC family protein [Bacteroidales bacterium]HPD23175.1 TolC family protein [Bacteroidales bacterium]HRS99104.1 TolC family protein [Bacteroidales bacterium]
MNLKKQNILILLCISIICVKVFSQSDTIYLSLEKCKEIAFEKNYGIKISESQVVIAENIRKSAKTNYFGQLSLGGQYQLTNKPFQVLNGNVFLPVVPFWSIDQGTMDLRPDILQNPLLNGIVINPATGEVIRDPQGNPLFFFYSYLPAEQLKFGTHHNFLFGPGFIQPVYLGSKIRNAYRIAKSTRNIAEIQLESEKKELIYKVEEAYWRIIDLQEKLKLTETAQEFLNRLYYDVNNFHEEGIVTKLELLQVEMKLTELELNKTKLENGLRISYMALNQIMGLDPHTQVFLSDNAEKINVYPPPSAVEKTLVYNRNEIKILDETTNISLAQQEIFKSRFLPNVNLMANYLFMNPNPYKGFDKSFGSDWTAGINIQIPITHWGDRIYTMRASNEIVEIARLKREEAVSLIILDMNLAWNNYTEAIKNLNLLKKSMELAAEILRVAQDNYDEGIISVSKLLEAETNYVKAQTEYVEAKTKLKLCELEYLKKTGELKF